MKNKVKAIAIIIFLTFTYPSHALSQESFEYRVNQIINELTAKIDIPEPIKVKIYSEIDIGDLANFSMQNQTPTININEWSCVNLSEKALSYLLAHELGHYFDSVSRLRLYVSQIQWDFEGQFMAEAFALYALGEDLFKTGRNEVALMYFYNIRPEEKWLIKNDQTYYALQLNHIYERTEWWLTKAKERLNQIPLSISLRNREPINPEFKSTR